MRTLARVHTPKHAWMFTPAMGVDVALNQADVLAHLIAEEMSLGDMMTLLKLRKGQYALVEEQVHPRPRRSAAPSVTCHCQASVRSRPSSAAVHS